MTELIFFNGFELMWNWNFPEVANLPPKVYSTSLYAWGVIGSFENGIVQLNMFYT